MKNILYYLCLAIWLSGCSTLPPKNSDNLCSAFTEKDEWYQQANQAYQKWGIPVPVLMAIMHQESHFVADAKPPRDWLLGFIPWGRVSSAYGYAQALDGTWDNYVDSAGSWFADRDDFADATDFIGWYCSISANKLGIRPTDVKNLYLAYHEGHKGFQHKTYLKKPWLRKVAEKVAQRADLFQYQLNNCMVN